MYLGVNANRDVHSFDWPLIKLLPQAHGSDRNYIKYQISSFVIMNERGLRVVRWDGFFIADFRKKESTQTFTGGRGIYSTSTACCPESTFATTHTIMIWYLR